MVPQSSIALGADAAHCNIECLTKMSVNTIEEHMIRTKYRLSDVVFAADSNKSSTQCRQHGSTYVQCI